ncbi:transposase family protein [Streptomyces griseofuscus]|uniref:transposase family protein n=1 Tax=Streptomyces griseofuscus TaxID=146922 RepID=UPI00381D330C
MVPRLEGLLLPSVADVSVLSLDVSHEAIRIDVCSTADGAACPDCGSESTRVHSSYLRFPADVPSGGRLVVLRLRVRRFFCPESSCARRTFAEQMPGLTRRHSRWTEGLRSTLAAVGLALAGRAGARMARAFGVPKGVQPGRMAGEATRNKDRLPGPRAVLRSPDTLGRPRSHTRAPSDLLGGPIPAPPRRMAPSTADRFDR